ncbi:MAG: asparagine synthase (glutamine-hydrolyzing) [bacterium]
MCGICGIIYDDPSRPVEREVLVRMNRTMSHRGPDDEGYYIADGAGLAMRRLAIIDVDGGRQPVMSEKGDVIALENGEIYNFEELRRELLSKGHLFKSRTDSEVIPHLYEEEGEGLPKRLNGMFGIAVWDSSKRVLLLARDRMGEKPLYWTKRDGALIFASELKAILAYGKGWRPDRCAIQMYLAHEYVPAPHTIFEGVSKLEAGEMLLLKGGVLELRRYWSVPLGQERNDISETEAREKLLRLLSNSVKQRLVSDVPLGVFLSGGVDSSTILAMMARHMRPGDIKTFSISFSERSFDESHHARRVAGHFGTDHHEELCSPDSLIEILPKVTELLDEPFADPSIIPTYALSRFTREHVTVALGGDGGDELFAGYPTFQAERAANWYLKLPRAMRRSLVDPLARALTVSDENMSRHFLARQFLKGVERKDASRHPIWMGAFSDDELSELMIGGLACDVYSVEKRLYEEAFGSRGGNDLLYCYMRTYLAEDIFTKVDRASMGVSLETRAPFMAPEVVEFVSRLPYSMKLRGFRMKHLLKDAVSDLLPRGIAARPKKGFGVPIAKWVKGPLREMTLDLLSQGRMKREGFFDPEVVEGIVGDHFAGRADNRKKIWTLLMFQRWMERWGNA